MPPRKRPTGSAAAPTPPAPRAKRAPPAPPAPRAKRATPANTEADQIIRNAEGQEFVVWGDYGSLFAVRELLPSGRTGNQHGANLETEPYYHTGRTWTEPPPDAPAPPLTEWQEGTEAGWLAPTGDFYPCRYAQHRDLSYTLAYHFKLYDAPEYDGAHFNNNNELALERAGWLKLTRTSGHFYWFAPAAKVRRITQRQLDFLLSWQTANPTQELPYWLDPDTLTVT